MKTTKLLAAAIALLMGISAHAQFTASTNPESVASSTAGGWHTFNDCRAYRMTSTSTLYMMNVVGWHGTSPGIYYEVPLLSISGTIPLPAGSNYGDVVLSTDVFQTNLYMNVVYNDGSGNFVFETYQWTGSAFNFMGSTSWADVGSSTQGLIRIDATKNGDYAISVNYSDGSVDIGGGTNASLPSMPSLTAAFGAGTAAQTDVCLNSDPFAVTTNVHLAFTDLADKKIYHAEAPFSTMAISSVGGIVGSAPSTVYYELRIASPNTNAPLCPKVEVFSVIYNEVTPAYYYEHQYNQDATGITNALLTGGAAGYPPTVIQYSKRPAVTYNEHYSFTFPKKAVCSGATISGWVSGLPTMSMIGEKTLSNGTMWGPVTYYDITNPSRTSCDNIAISSKYAGDQVLVSYIDGAASQVIYKTFSWAAPTMRQGRNNTITGGKEKMINVFPNPFSDRLYVDAGSFAADAQMHVQVTDVTGRISWSYEGTPDNLQDGANNWLGSAVPGIYYLKIADNENFNQTVKLVKQ
jgi:hypothetical protein